VTHNTAVRNLVGCDPRQGQNETSRVHHPSRRLGRRVVVGSRMNTAPTPVQRCSTPSAPLAIRRAA